VFDGQPSAQAAGKSSPANRLPVERRFKAGQSGNPRGRPKKDLDLAALAQKHAETAINTLVEVMKDPTATPAARVSAASEVLDRGYGRAPAHGTLNIEHGFSAQFEDFIRELTGKPARKLIEIEENISEGVVIPLEPRQEVGE